MSNRGLACFLAAFAACGCQRDRAIRLAGCAGDGLTRVSGTLTVISMRAGAKADDLFLLTDKQGLETLVRPDATVKARLASLKGQQVEVAGRLSEKDIVLPSETGKDEQTVKSLRRLAQADGNAVVPLSLTTARFLDPCLAAPDAGKGGSR
jgi:hypothetical protein